MSAPPPPASPPLPPADTAELRVDQALAALGVPAEILPCDPDLADTAAFCAAYGIPPEASANTIVVASRRGPDRRAACVVLATTRLDVNGAVRRELGVRKASFAGPDETAVLTGMVLGGVTPFGLPEDVVVLIDGAVLAAGRVVVGGGSRRRKLWVEAANLLRLPAARAVEGLAAPSPARHEARGGPEPAAGR